MIRSQRHDAVMVCTIDRPERRNALDDDHLAGHGHARAMLLAAATLDAEAALRTGFAQRAGGPDDAIAWATEIAALAPLSVAGQKLALDRLAGKDAADDDVGDAFEAVWTSADRLEGIRALREKRPPRFEGR